MILWIKWIACLFFWPIVFKQSLYYVPALWMCVYSVSVSLCVYTCVCVCSTLIMKGNNPIPSSSKFPLLLVMSRSSKVDPGVRVCLFAWAKWISPDTHFHTFPRSRGGTHSCDAKVAWPMITPSCEPFLSLPHTRRHTHTHTHLCKLWRFIQREQRFTVTHCSEVSQRDWGKRTLHRLRWNVYTLEKGQRQQRIWGLAWSHNTPLLVTEVPVIFLLNSSEIVQNKDDAIKFIKLTSSLGTFVYNRSNMQVAYESKTV